MTFKAADEIVRDEHDWGTFAAVSSPADGAERIMTVEATFLPGKSHAFHRHPNQEEVIYVLDIPDQLPELRQLFPQRRFYIYEREELSPKGTLRPLRRPGLAEPD